MVASKSTNSDNSKTPKNMNTSKVRNTKAQSQFKTGKNTVSESLIRESFQPLFSPKDGMVRLTFCGIEHPPIKNKKDKPYLKIAFSCYDVTNVAPQTIAILNNYNFSEKNKLGIVLGLMGFQVNKNTEVVDENNEYGIRQTVNNIDDIFDFLRSKVGLVFKGNLITATRKDKITGEIRELKGLWDIVPESLIPYLEKGEQVSDWNSSDITDEDFENPQIDMCDEAG